MKRKKNIHAVILGRMGGKAGTGAAKARTSKQARKASLARLKKTASVILFCLLAGFIRAQTVDTNAPSGMFSWAVKSKYTDHYSKIVFNSQINFSDNVMGKVVMLEGRSFCCPPPCDAWLYGKVYLASLGGCIQIYFPEDCDAARKTTASDAKCYVYIPDNDLQEQILKDLKSLKKTTIKNLNKKFVIMLGTKRHVDMNKTTYRW